MQAVRLGRRCRARSDNTPLPGPMSLSRQQKTYCNKGLARLAHAHRVGQRSPCSHAAPPFCKDRLETPTDMNTPQPKRTGLQSQPLSVSTPSVYSSQKAS